ncbi:MAG: class II SORL domain-containing protein [Candidatus Krumholzibacteria bacterium]|jgi:superoxide reductase|nr:class II SORL domain-containing protein [Candidatus Krumholzibacteria bacterium]
MPKVNRYVDIDTVEREAKKDYIDRHSPFIECAGEAKKGEKFAITVRVGKEYTHPDDTDHFIKSIQLYNGETLLGEAGFVSGTLGGQDQKGQAEVTFRIVPTGSRLKLSAIAYCTKHGLWESDPMEVTVED